MMRWPYAVAVTGRVLRCCVALHSGATVADAANNVASATDPDDGNVNTRFCAFAALSLDESDIDSDNWTRFERDLDEI